MRRFRCFFGVLSLHFQEDQKPDLLEIQWPSGRLDRINNPPYDMEIRVTESSGKAENASLEVQVKRESPSNSAIDRSHSK